MITNINYSVFPVQFGDRNKPVTLNIVSSINFSEFFNNQMFSDLKITINSDIIYAHKFILIQKSKYFRDFCSLTNNSTNKTLSIPVLFDIKKLFFRVIKYLYTNEISFSRCELVYIYEISHFYSIDSLKLGLENLVYEEIKNSDDPKETVKVFIDDYHKAVSELDNKLDFLQFGIFIAVLIVKFDVDIDVYRPLMEYKIYISIIEEMIKANKLKNYRDIINHTISFTDNFFDNKKNMSELEYITEILRSLLDRPVETEYHASYEDLRSYIENSNSPEWLKLAFSQIVF